MNETQQILTALIAGVLIGTVFFGGRWWTAGNGLASRHAALWFIGGALVRMSFALTGFYFIGRDDWQRLLACLFGFILARVVVMRRTDSQMQHCGRSSTEAQNAS